MSGISSAIAAAVKLCVGMRYTPDDLADTVSNWKFVLTSIGATPSEIEQAARALACGDSFPRGVDVAQEIESIRASARIAEVAAMKTYLVDGELVAMTERDAAAANLIRSDAMVVPVQRSNEPD